MKFFEISKEYAFENFQKCYTKSYLKIVIDVSLIITKAVNRRLFNNNDEFRKFD